MDSSATDGNPEEIAVPYLLAIPANVVDLLRKQGRAHTPHEVLQTIDEFLLTNTSIDTLNWDLLRKWCLVAAKPAPSKTKAN